MSPDDVRVALRDIDIGRIESIEQIKHGLTNDSWLVRASNDVYVIRRSNTSEVSLQIDRRSEALILDAVARAGLGPEIVLNDLNRHVLVTRYAGPNWTAQQAADPANIERLATVLRKLHRLEPPAGIRRVDLLSVTEGYLRTLDEHGVSIAVARPAMRARAAAVVAGLPSSSGCLCHNDIHALNIVDSGELRLIDWEYAGAGEPFFDLASICVYHEYGRTQREQLLRGYAVSHNQQTWERLELCCWLFGYIRDLWTAVRELSEKHHGTPSADSVAT